MSMETVLCVDIGNSRLKWGVCCLNDLSFSNEGVITELSNLASSDLNACFDEIKPQQVWISSVASADTVQLLSDWFVDSWDVTVTVIGFDSNIDSKLNGYKVTSELGLDRWLAMVAGQKAAGEDFCVIDAGTAITIDVVVKGKHQGGVIMPGKSLMISSLHNKTENIRAASGMGVALADNTADGVVSGVLASVAGGVDKVLSRVKKMYPDIVVIITGGDAGLVERLCGFEMILEKNLVLQGVGVVARDAYA